MDGKKGNSEILNVPRGPRIKFLKNIKKNTKKKKIEKSKLVTSKAILLKIRYFFFF